IIFTGLSSTRSVRPRPVRGTFPVIRIRSARMLLQFLMAAGACAACILLLFAVASYRRADSSPDVPIVNDEQFPPRQQDIDDSGFGVIEVVRPPVQDPLSLEHIRDCFHHAGYRGIAKIERDLAAGNLPDEQVMMAQLLLAQLNLYEGE